MIRIYKHCEEIDDSLESLIQRWNYWNFEELCRSLKSGSYTLSAFEKENVCVGVLLTLQNVDTVDIIYLYTDLQFRREGIALKLLQDCEERLKKEKNVHSLFLEVRKDNVPAQKLYNSFGMSLVTERKKYYKDGCDALIFHKEWK